EAASQHHFAGALDELALAIYRSQRTHAFRQASGDVLEAAEARDFLDKVGLLDQVGAERRRDYREDAFAARADLRADRFETAARDCRRDRSAEQRFHRAKVERYLARL